MMRTGSFHEGARVCCWRRLVILGVLAFGAAALIACHSEPVSQGQSWPLEPGSAAGYNLLLVTLDTVRRDRLGCYGYAGALTSTLDRLAAKGLRFDDAVTSVPLTLPSHATILTGLYPPNHGIRNNGRGALPSEQLTLAESLRDRGYDTAAFIGAFVLDARFGLDQGFATYDFEVDQDGYRPSMPDFNERAADRVTDAALAWFRGRDNRAASPFFVWLHYFDAHEPYTSPLSREPALAGRPYDAEIAFVDEQLGRLLDELAASGPLARTLLVVTADHGEGLGEHGEQTHGMLLYDPTVRVPLILFCPALLRGAQVDRQPVGLVDLRPTLEALLGLQVTLPCDGESLLGQDRDRDRAIYLETREPLDLAGWSPLDGLRTRTHKLLNGPVPRLFDLAADPQETNNLYGSALPVEERLREELAALQLRRCAERPSPRQLSDEDHERLRSLGYVTSETAPEPQHPVDPESMMPVLALSSQAEQLYLARRLEQAEQVAHRVLEQWPTSPHALRVLAFTLLKTGRADDAIALLRQAVDRQPDIYLVRSLAQLLILDQEYAAAEEVLVLYEELAPLDGRVEMLRGDIQARQDRREEALAAYERALSLDPNRIGPALRDRIVSLAVE
jgi:choline-sulfatase